MKTKSKAHGAPVQCTKGKCPKAFHVNCAREGHALGIMFTVMREVEKEVVLLDPSPPSSLTDNRSESMNVNSSHATNDLTVAAPILQSSLSRVLKVIKKLDVQILCTQHNPVRKRCYTYLPLIIFSSSICCRLWLPRRRLANKIRYEMIFWLYHPWQGSRFESVPEFLKSP